MVLTAVILSNKKEKDIYESVGSVSFADEVIIVKDSEDKTVKTDRGVRIIARPLKSDFSAQRNFGIQKAIGDWILFVDDDEVVTGQLAKEIRKRIKENKYDAYFLKRVDRYFGQTLKHGETGDIQIIRLAKKGAGGFVRPVHEKWEIKGRVGKLSSPLLHDRSELVSPFFDRMTLYGPIDAKALTAEGKSFSVLRLILNPVGKFFQNYLLRLGFLDGYLGLFQAYLMSVQSLSVRVFQWQTKF